MGWGLGAPTWCMLVAWLLASSQQRLGLLACAQPPTGAAVAKRQARVRLPSKDSPDEWGVVLRATFEPCALCYLLLHNPLQGL